MRSRAARLAALVLSAGGLAVGCADPEPSSPTADDLAEIDLSADHTIEVDEDGFDPSDLEIVAGEVVVLVNRGTAVHTFTADERFDTGRLEPGDRTTLVLTEPGVIPYRDLEDPDHEGTLTVSEAPG